MILKAEDFKTVKVLEDRLNEKDRERFYVVIESVMCTKTKVGLSELFENRFNHLVLWHSGSTD